MRKWISDNTFTFIILLFLLPFIFLASLYLFTRWNFSNYYSNNIAPLSVIDEKNVKEIREMVKHRSPSKNPPLIVRNVKYLCGFMDQCQGDKYVSPYPPCSADVTLFGVYENDKSTEFNEFIDWYWELVWIETKRTFYGPFRRASFADKPSFSFLMGASLLGIRSCK